MVFQNPREWLPDFSYNTVWKEEWNEEPIDVLAIEETKSLPNKNLTASMTLCKMMKNIEKKLEIQKEYAKLIMNKRFIGEIK